MASIRKRPNGAWRARYRDPDGQERARHFTRKVDAQAWLDEVTTSMVTGQYVDPGAGAITFADFYAEWSARQVWVWGTEQAMAIAVDSVGFSGLPLRAIRRSHVESWVKGMVARGLAPSTVRTRFSNVRSVFRAAVRDRRIAVDPAEGVTLPRLPRGDTVMRLPLVSEVKALLDVADEEFVPVLALAAFAGLRAGEVRGLQLGDVDFLGRTLHVRRQAQHEGAGVGPAIRAPKYNSARSVYLPDPLVAVLSEHVAAFGVGDGGSWLFAGPDGGPMHKSAVDRRWQKARSRAGVPDIRLHDLRHFYASGLIAEGCDVVTVQRALGHAKATTTLSVYSHLWPSAEDRTRRAAGVLFGAVADCVADSRRTGSEV